MSRSYTTPLPDDPRYYAILPPWNLQDSGGKRNADFYNGVNALRDSLLAEVGYVPAAADKCPCGTCCR